ncbi:MAG TPA: lamin tail domain-containing protein [Chloroflexia bacterium]|nr:lamin tail domain-containing protein [Chloroflexia bacterium]
MGLFPSEPRAGAEPGSPGATVEAQLRAHEARLARLERIYARYQAGRRISVLLVLLLFGASAAYVWLVYGPVLLNRGGLASSSPVPGAATTVEITDVYNAVNPADEWFQLYNMTHSDLTLAGWQICPRATCVALPTTTIPAFSLAKFQASALPGWPAAGLDGARDMLGLKDDQGRPVDCLNWGAPSATWANAGTFQSMLWPAGIPPPNPGTNQAFSRQAIGYDTNQPSDWLVTANKSP